MLLSQCLGPVLALSSLRPVLSLRSLPSLALLALLSTANTAVSLAALSATSIPLYNALRRTGFVFVLVLEAIWLRRPPHPLLAVPAALVLLGSLLTSHGDLSHAQHAPSPSYLLALLSNALTACYVLAIQHTSATTRLSPIALVYSNCALSLPLLLVLAVGRGEVLHLWLHFPYLGHGGFVCALLASVGLAFLLNYATFLNTTLNSPSMHAMVAQLKDMLSLAGNMLFFDSFCLTASSCCGLLLTLVGSVWYSRLTFTLPASTTTSTPTVATAITAAAAAAAAAAKRS